VRMPDVLPCSTPAQVPWLSVSQETGATLAGEDTEVTVLLDSTGLAAGTHAAQLCVTSDDAGNPLVPVRITLTVTEPACDRTITGTYEGPLQVTSGLTCLAHGSAVNGAITVRPGAGLFASGTTVTGSVSATGAATMEIYSSTVTGPVQVRGATGALAIAGSDVTGVVWLTDNNTGDTPIVVAGNRIVGALSCTGNTPSPVNNDEPNEVDGWRSGQCTDL
jgi:hypothetical protein